MPGVLGAALATGVIIGMVASAPVLFVSSVGGGAVQKQYSLACPANTGVTMDMGPHPFRMTPDGPEPVNPLEVLVEGVAGDPMFAAPEVVRGDFSPAKATFGDRTESIGFLARADWHDHVEMLSAEVPGDVWLPDTIADELGVAPGDVIDVRTNGGADVSLTVAGVFRDLASRRLNSFWCAAENAIVPIGFFSELVPPPMAIVEPDTFAALPLQLSLEKSFTRYVAEFAHPPRTLAEAEHDVAAAAVVEQRLAEVDPDAEVFSSIDRIGVRGHTVREAVRDTTLPVAALAVICALALASVLGLLWVRARRTSCIALATIGVSPAALGLKAALETGLAVVVGSVGGTYLAFATLGAWAPATDLEPGTLALALAVAVATAVVGLVLVAATAAVSCRSLLRHSAPARRSWVRFVPFELAFALIAWQAARTIGTEALVPIEGKRVVDTSSSVLVLPLAVLALGAALTARLWWWLTRRPRSHALPSRLPRRLALRRLQHGSKAGTAILGAGTLALGVSVFGLAMNSSLERTGEAKSAVYVGSDVALLIVRELPPGVPGASEVWVRNEMEYGGQPVDLIAVDPATFAAVAFWDDAFDERSLPDLLGELDAGVADGAVRVIAVGDVPATGEITNPNLAGDPFPAQVVERVDAFPGAHLKNPTLIMSRAAAQAGPINFRHFVWAKGTFAYWRLHLQEIGAAPLLGISRQDAVDSSVLKFAAWSFDFVKALGVFVGALVTAALVLHLAVRQRQQALGFAFLRRMGLSHRRHWWALVFEVGAMMLTIFLLGSALALLCVRIVSPHVDPLPILLPTPLMVVPWGAIAVTGLIAAAVVFVGSAAAQWSGARVDVAEVLRDGT